MHNSNFGSFVTSAVKIMLVISIICCNSRLLFWVKVYMQSRWCVNVKCFSVFYAILCILHVTCLQSAAGLCVGIGSFCDPTEIPGLAHFLEHSQ